jgi:hypothetical protein
MKPNLNLSVYTENRDYNVQAPVYHQQSQLYVDNSSFNIDRTKPNGYNIVSTVQTGVGNYRDDVQAPVCHFNIERAKPNLNFNGYIMASEQFNDNYRDNAQAGPVYHFNIERNPNLNLNDYDIVTTEQINYRDNVQTPVYQPCVNYSRFSTERAKPNFNYNDMGDDNYRNYNVQAPIYHQSQLYVDNSRFNNIDRTKPNLNFNDYIMASEQFNDNYRDNVQAGPVYHFNTERSNPNLNLNDYDIATISNSNYRDNVQTPVYQPCVNNSRFSTERAKPNF